MQEMPRFCRMIDVKDTTSGSVQSYLDFVEKIMHWQCSIAPEIFQTDRTYVHVSHTNGHNVHSEDNP